MKKIIGLVFISLILSFNTMAQELWKEGVHYNIVSKEATEKKEVIEFFSFWCPHCYNFEPIVEQLKKDLPSDVEFKKVHVNFMRSASRDTQDDATRALLVGRLLKKEAEIVSAIFNYYHVQRNPITGLEDLKSMLVTSGVSVEEFEKQAQGFSINSLLNRNNGLITKYQRHLTGVPNFIVNGKYQAIFTRDMKPDDMIALLVWLSEQK
jgi:thiol:disulfide interchange protein DsbA